MGDETHLTFFEMLGNFSFGGYFKKEAIELAHEFITKEMKLPISYVTVFSGDSKVGVPKDEESRGIWNAFGISDVREEGMSDVFWGPTGSSGPCGPTTEIYCRNAAGQDVEIWNIVFNQYFYPGSREELNSGAAGKALKPLETPGVDTGMGLERLAMVSQGKKNIFETDLFLEPFKLFMLAPSGVDLRSGRIFADHVRGSIFLIADGVRPSNKNAGYILRRLIRRAVVHSRKLTGEDQGGGTALSLSNLRQAVESGISYYGGTYSDLLTNKQIIQNIFDEEVAKFVKTLDVGLKEFLKLYPELQVISQTLKPGEKMQVQKSHVLKEISGETAFNFHQSYGLTIDIIRDLAREGLHQVNEKEFEEAFKKHQEISRAGQERKFGGHGLLLDTGELKAGNEDELKIVTRLHTATHMLQSALREVLGPEVHQAGSDITAERTRFDFTFPRKLIPEEIKKVEDIVNEKIKEDLPMQKVVLPKAEAEKTGALYFFKEKYPDPVNVYFIGRDIASAWSKEFCGGPHVTHTGEIGKFKIVKEEAVGAGVRRIRAVVE